jgi:hypothetical protein
MKPRWFISLEKPFLKSKFFVLPLSFFLFPLAFALPLQAPIPGMYQCFGSSEGPFEANVDDINATLEFPTSQTYRFTTASATEEGSVSSFVLETSDNADDEVTMTTLWQGGSVLQLQPSSGSAPYRGAFFIDNLGHSYAVVQNNNGI